MKSFYIVFVFIYINYLSLTLCVDRSNFKTCNDSGFCKRHRSIKPGNEDYKIIQDSVEILKSKLSGKIKHEPSNTQYTFELTKLVGRVFRLQINEADPIKPRYSIPMGDVLVTEPPLEAMSISFKDGAYYATGASGEKAILYINPLRLDVYLHDIPLISANARGLFEMEYSRRKSHEPQVEEKPVEENTEGTLEEKGEKKEEAPKPEENGSWEESFKGHHDSKPNGPNSVGMDFTFPGFEHVYGIPEHADSLALRNTDSTEPYRLFNLDVFEYELNNPMALYGSVPLLWAHNVNNTAGIFWLNPSETWVDIRSTRGSQGTFSKLLSLVKSSGDVPQVDTHWFSESGVLDVYLFATESPSEAVFLYGQLTGTTPLPPLHSISYHQCRWNYNDQEDVLGVDENFDKHDIPYDVIWLDIEHTDSKKYFTWDSGKFPDPSAMVDRLAAKGRKLVTVIDPHIKRDDDWGLFKEARDKGLFIKKSDGSTDYEGWCWPGSSSWIDFTNPEARSWWATQFLTYVSSRADNTFTWNDMGEPSVFNGPEVTMHKDAVHHQGWEHRDVHNLYGMHVHRASWEGQLLRSSNNERPFVLTRAFFAGSQRYGAVWTGDNKADWDHLKASVPMVLSLSIAGITFSGADVGGFFGNPESELMTRWYQAGSYQPFFRAHAHLDTKRREPWLLPEPDMKIIRKAIQERYALLPYWYTTFQRSETTNEPVMAPLWYHFSKDPNTFAIDDQHLIGDAVLVKPVTASGVSKLDVYLPTTNLPGHRTLWYAKDSWRMFKGGESVSVPVIMDTIPVFYRGGRIIPRRERARRSSRQTRFDPFTLLILLDGQGEATGQLYIDDYHTLRYKNSEFASYFIQFKAGELRLRSLDHSATYPQASKLSIERVVFVGMRARPSQIKVKSELEAEARAVEFNYLPQIGLAVVRKPEIKVTSDWVMKVDLEGGHEAWKHTEL